ncbi:hypothetical protein CON67_20365 [Bacillus toyonensis]|nr:hypothetical protein CON67_20365 [Bacillus toyonensis]
MPIDIHLSPKIGVSHLHIFEEGVFCRKTIKGIETIHALYKRRRSLQQSNFIFAIYKLCDRTVLPI